MKMMAGEAKNVCSVGDEDQSIYSLARSRAFATFWSSRRIFPTRGLCGWSRIPPHRSTQVILEAAGAVVAKPTCAARARSFWTDRQGGSLIGYYEAPDGENEALFIADRIQRFLRESPENEGSMRLALRGVLSDQLAVAAC